MRRFASRFHIRNTIDIHRSVAKNGQNIDDFHLFSIALRWIFIASRIWKREVNLRIVLHLFCIYHFVL
jgi:hypothetical protein